jgi:hypothetical protein
MPAHSVGIEEATDAALATVKHPHIGNEGAPTFISMQFNVVLNTSNPVAGSAIRLRSAVVNLGGSRPLLLLCTSSTAEGWGVVPPMTV